VRVLVTGSSGFIGRNLVAGLAPRHEVLAPTHGELDLTDTDAVRAYLRHRRPDAVVHGAAKPGHRAAKDPSGVAEANLRMFQSLVDDPGLCPRMVFLSSGAVYDARHYLPKMPETYLGAYEPADENGRSKAEIARRIEGAEHVVELRPFGVYGPLEDYRIRFISNAICKTLFDLPVTLRQDRLFDYIHVDDLVRVVEHFMTRPRSVLEHAAYNVTPDEAVSLLTIARMVVGISEKDLEVVVADAEMGLEYSGDNSRLRAEMPGLALTPLGDGIRALYDWYAVRVGEIDRTALLVDK
jgi:UDP-glucose 4-epimerase